MSTAGLIVTAYMVPYAVLQLCYGPLADRIGRLPIARLALLLFAIGAGACAFAGSIEQLILVRFITGAAAAAVFPMALAYIGDAFEYDERAGAIGVMMTATSSSFLVSVTVSGILAGFVGWRSLFLVTGSATLLVVCALLWVRAGQRPAANRGAVAGYRHVFATPMAVGLAVVAFIEGVLMTGAIAYIGAYMRETWALPYAVIGLILVPNGIAALIVSRYLAAIARQVSEQIRFGVGMSVCGVAYVLAATAVDWWVMPIALFVLGGAFVSAHTVLQARVTDVAPDARGTAIAVFSCTLFMGGAAGTAAMGASIGAIGYETSFTAIGVGFVAMATTGYLLLRRPRMAAAEE